MKIELVIFDCDGVLVDSEQIAQEVLSSILGELGLHLSVDEVGHLFFGKTVPQCIAIAEDLLGAPIPTDFIAAWRERLYETFRTQPVLAVEGVREVLEKLELPVCVVSNGPIEKMQTTLGVTGLLPFFADRLFSPDLGIAGKPAPDLFLAAADSFSVQPSACVVIEDSSGGVRGARSAGMCAFGFTGLPHVNAQSLEEAGATLFSSMHELPKLLGLQ